jgi:hypothetical protein
VGPQSISTVDGWIDITHDRPSFMDKR